MDALYKKLHHVNETVYFLRSSIENPYIYLRFIGTVRELQVDDDKTYYRICIDRVLEDQNTIQRYLNRARFRVKSGIDGKFIDKFFYVYDLPLSTFENALKRRFYNYWLDMPSMLVYSTHDEMVDGLNSINEHLIKKISNTMQELQIRIGNG